MKVSDAEVIRSSEGELIDAITADLDWGTIEDIFRNEHGLGIDEDVEYKKGDIVVYEGRVAYRLDFEVKVTLSVLLDRDGTYISMKSSRDFDRSRTQKEESIPGAQGPSSSETVPPEQALHPGTDPEAPFNDPGTMPSPSEGVAPEDKISRMASQASDVMVAMES